MSFNTYPQNPFPPNSENAGCGGSPYVLPIASANDLGGVKVGNNLIIDSNGVLSAPAPVPNYSTKEQATGQKWIDGKEIYQKTIDFGVLPNNTTKTVISGITGIDIVLRLEGIANSSAGGAIPLPYVDDTSKIGDVLLDFNKTTGNVRIISGSDKSVYYGYVTIYYTKSESEV